MSNLSDFMPGMGLRNRIINGKMDIAQRGTSFSGTSPGYTLDRWTTIGAGVTSAVTITQQADVPSSNEFQSSLRTALTTADSAIATGDLFSQSQMIEGYNLRDLIGKTFTLSFWVRSSKTGIHCVRFGNSGNDRSYVAEYTISAANTWEYKTVTVSGGLITAATWNWTTGRGLIVAWVMAAGATYQTTANAWQTGDFYATSNQVNCLDTIGNIFAITGVQLEPGGVATPFEQRPYGMELALCQRYYYKISFSGSTTLGPATTGSGIAQTSVAIPVPFRSTPTVTTTGSFSFRQASSDTTLSSPGVGADLYSGPVAIGWTMTNIGNGISGGFYSTTAGSLALSAEL